jgi:hypothetical protein
MRTGRQIRSAVAILVYVGLTQTSSSAVEGHWVAFDSAFPADFVDTSSIVQIRKGVVRYWERAGAFPLGDGPDGKFPQYTLVEMDCETHQDRTIRWDIALEAPMTSAALQARAKFAKAMASLQQKYPTEWESLEPTPHQYALLNFVCHI